MKGWGGDFAFEGWEFLSSLYRSLETVWSLHSTGFTELPS